MPLLCVRAEHVLVLFVHGFDHAVLVIVAQCTRDAAKFDLFVGALFGELFVVVVHLFQKVAVTDVEDTGPLALPLDYMTVLVLVQQ